MQSLKFLRNSLRTAVAAALITSQALPAEIVHARSSTTDLLIQKARSLEARDRADLAAQVWQQVLVTNPNQPDALAGLARWAKRSGKTEEANAYLGRLRRVSPDAPALTQLDSADSVSRANGRLDEAGKLAAGGHADEAMRIYREVFGATPPPGGWAVAYYETLANTSGGFEPAVAALRKLAESYPDVPTYQLAAGRLMSYRPATRQSGIALLSSFMGSTAAAAKAREAWRQALMWEKSNPAYLAAIEAYLNRYPDAELQAATTRLRAQAGKEKPFAETREEQLGYSALKGGNTADAEREFSAALAKDDKNARAHAGLAFVKMKSNDFDGAVQHFEAAQKLSPNDSTVRTALGNARFWQAMHVAGKAADAGDWNEAAKYYQAALALRPNSEEATRALGGALIAAGSPAKAIPYLTTATRSKALDEESWCALVTAKLHTEGGKAALKVIDSAPTAFANTLKRNVGWRALEAAAYFETGEESRATDIYRELMAINSPKLSGAEQVQLASLALQLHQPADALPFARKAVDAMASDPGAWEVLVSALVASGRPQEAERVSARMPEKVRVVAMTHPAFVEALASLKEANGDLQGARMLLEQAVNYSGAPARADQSNSAKLYLAQILAKLGRGTEAEAIVNAAVDARPEDTQTWRARFLVLQSLNRQTEIVRAASHMPQSVAVRLGTQADMVTLLARAQGAAGDPAFGVRLLETYIARLGDSDAAGTFTQRIQLGWLLLNVPAQSGRLFSVLEGLNSRTDLNDDQRKEVTKLWTTWILRSSEAAHRAGNDVRQLGLLEQGLNLFPGNPELERALAGNLLAAGKTKRAFNIYSNWGLTGGRAEDYAGAIGAAIAERNPQYADTWLQAGLSQWPNDPKLLELAGERAKAQGDLKKAELFWKEALAQKRAQSNAGDLASADDPQTSLKSLLVASNERPYPGRQLGEAGSDAADAFGPPQEQGTARVHLSSLQNSDRVREDFVRANGFLGGTETPAAALRSSLLAKPVLPAPSPVDSLEDKIASLESRNTPYLGSRMSIWGRGGEPGFGRLLIQQSEFEASTTLANSLRASLLLKPTFLSGGTATGTGDSLFGRQTTAASFGPQTAGGVAAEAQFSTQSIGIRLGTTPQGFLTHNWIGGLRLQPKDGPLTILLERDSVKDTMLSYAGGRDPQSGQIWGGVMANTASLQGHWGDDRSGFYVSGGYQALEGRNVARNTAMTGNFGSWWKVAVLPTGSLTVGTNFSAMHYDKNLRYYTFGQGGYFSPQQYFLFNVPVRWTGSYGRRLQYMIGSSIGMQHFVEDPSNYYPTDASLQAKTALRYPGLANTGANFSFDARLNYQMAPHWILGAFANASNARNYTAGSAGIFVRYTFEERPMSFENALPSIPDWRGQQPFLLY